ncbi:MAG: hypothetical protein ACHQET_14225 [Chitinophagales bacterium]
MHGKIFKTICLGILLACMVAINSCSRKLSHDQVEQRLKEAMKTFLSHQEFRYDTSRAEFTIDSVVYFEDKKFYECEFNVHLKKKNYDTTGIMTARISKDFTTVTRKW